MSFEASAHEAHMLAVMHAARQRQLALRRAFFGKPPRGPRNGGALAEPSVELHTRADDAPKAGH